MPRKRPECRKDWDKLLKQKGLEVGFEVLQWNPYPVKRAKVLVSCEHKTQWVDPRGQLRKSHCCRSSAYRNCPSPGSGNFFASGVPTPEQRLLPGTLYLIRYLDEDGTHFKLGITKRSLSERFSKGQLISIIHLHHATLGECFDLEQSLLKWAKEKGYRYSSSTTTELIHPAAIPLLLKNDSFNSICPF
jgi:hypothetical protein